MSEKKSNDMQDCKKFYNPTDGKCLQQTDWNDIAETGKLNVDEWRFLVINLGTAGAGKSSSFDTIKKYTHTIIPSSKRRDNWIQLNHDTFVSHDDRYKDAVEQYETTNKRLRKHKLDARKIMEDTYNSIRKGISPEKETSEYITSLWDGKTSFNPQDKDSDALIENYGTQVLLYQELINSIISGKNIAYEATGAKWDTILNIFNTIEKYNCDAKSLKYIVIVSFTDTTSQQVLQNISVRWQKSIEAYRSISKKQSASQSDFELPKPWNLGDKNINLKAITHIKNKIRELSTCYNEKTGEGEGEGIGPDILVIFDKTTSKISEPSILPLSKRGTLLFYKVRLRRTMQHRASLKKGKLIITSLYKKAHGSKKPRKDTQKKEKKKKKKKKHSRKR